RQERFSKAEAVLSASNEQAVQLHYYLFSINASSNSGFSRLLIRGAFLLRSFVICFVFGHYQSLLTRFTSAQTQWMVFTESGCSVSSTGVSGIIRTSDGCIVLTDKLHQFPRVIKYNGQCPIFDYFQPKITGVVVDELELKEASFRGRKLSGATLSIPGSYCGFVLEKMKPEDHNGISKASNSEEGGVDSWKETASLDNITYWNHDNLPSESDTFNCCFHWFLVANAIHKAHYSS
ncbi:hypothetical protein KI387_034435, partial [Taxus chinensis]